MKKFQQALLESVRQMRRGQAARVTKAKLLPAARAGRTTRKTTLELPDDLLVRARRAAQREGTTLRALVEEGLQLALRARAAGPQRKRFSIAPFAGDGLTAEFVGASWPLIRDEIHGRRLAADEGSSAQDES